MKVRLRVLWTQFIGNKIETIFLDNVTTIDAPSAKEIVISSMGGGVRSYFNVIDLKVWP